jgi:hypothetical protein
LGDIVNQSAYVGGAMFCESVHNEEEVFQAFLLYASLNGLNTDEGDVRARISRYLFKNQPDELIDAAILAFSEDRILAPPDIILDRWGKSRVYELESLATGGWRHQVCDSWFDAGCRFCPEHPVRLSHFWTRLVTDSIHEELCSGSRCSLRLSQAGNVQVVHRHHACLGSVPEPLASEIVASIEADVHYLVLIDAIRNQDCRLLVTRAAANVPVADVIEYAAHAFTTPRNKC